ncbi:hypothetical protein Taro_001917, partial [Colocasia esculenta]|nr:hypothetical protein [Colocasia esculenta]
MASRGRRGAQVREDEQRREERGEQQARAPQGPTVLPPPPLVDYGVFMQGLVQAMQTQAQTQATLHAQLQALASAPIPQKHGHGGPSIMERFKRMASPSLKGESQPLLVESWMREVEKIFRAIRCAEEGKVSLATYMLQERANVWWASVLRTRYEDGAIEALSGQVHPRAHLGHDRAGVYEARFAELSKYAPHIVADERRKAKKFVMGLKPSLRSRLVAFDHRTLDDALSAACRQESEMDQYLVEKRAAQKRFVPSL